MGAAGVAADVVGLGVGRGQLFRGGEDALVTHHGHRVVLAGVAAGDVVETGGGDGGSGLAGVAGDYGVDTEALVVPQQDGQAVVVFGRVEGDDAVALGVVHVDDVEGEAFAEAGEHQAGAVHGVGKAEEHGQVVSAGAALVGGQDKEGLGGAHRVGLYRVVVKFNLSYGGAGAADVAGGGIGQQVLAGAVQARIGGRCRWP